MSALYANAYEHRGPRQCFQFVGHRHESREEADKAARCEESAEPSTRRFGVWIIRPKNALAPRNDEC